MWDALLSQIPLNGYGAATYVVRNGNQSGFIQAHQGRSPAESYLTFMAPALAWNEDTPKTWQQLLETLCRGQGERGVQRIFAKLPAEAEAETDVFREVGFRVYAQEQIFRRSPPTTDGVRDGSIRLRPWANKDTWGIHRLYCMGAPRFVQQSEHLPGEIGEAATSDWAEGNHEERYVWDQQGEVVAYLRLLGGDEGHWMHLLLHPDYLEHTDELVKTSIARLAKYGPQPIYCTIRNYETDLAWSLKDAGFREFQTRFLLVKHTAVRVRRKAFDPLPQVEGVETAPTASVRIEGRIKQGEPKPVSSEVLTETR